MQILLCTSVFPDAGDVTVGPFNLALCRALAEHHEVAVVSPRRWTDLGRGRRQRPPGLPAAVDVTYPTWFHVPGRFGDHLHRFMGPPVARAATRLIVRHHSQVVVSYWAHPDGAVANQVARRARIPNVIVVGGSDVLTRRPGTGRHAVTARTLAQADAVVTVSHHLAEVVSDMGVPAERVHTVRQGVDPQVFHPLPASRPDGPPLVLWAGRMVPVKRLDVLVDAIAALVRIHPGVRVELIGDGPERAAVEARVQAAGLGDRVHLTGPRPQPEVADRMRAASVVVLTSDSEGIPNVLREAVACGTPFVATDVGGVSELTSPPWGRLVPAGNPEAVATALAEVLAERPSGPPPAMTTVADAAGELVAVCRRLVG